MFLLMRDIDELKVLMSEEQKLNARRAFEECTTFARDDKGNFIDLPCIAFDDEIDYLSYVDINDFED